MSLLSITVSLLVHSGKLTFLVCLVDLHWWVSFEVKLICGIGVFIWIVPAHSYMMKFNFSSCSKLDWYIVGHNGGKMWSKSTCIAATVYMVLWQRLPLRWRGKREGVRFGLIKAFDYSALWLCVEGEGKSRRIQRGQAGQIPQEENVETKAETWELRNPPCSSRCTQR